MSKNMTKEKTSKKATKKPAKSGFSKTKYYDLKRRVLGWEKDNYNRLAVVEDTNGMYKMFDHSAVIYAHDVAKRFKIQVELKNDSDFEMTTDKPVVLIHDVEVMEKRFSTIGIKKVSVDDGVTVYDLGYTLDPVEYKAMLTEAEELKKRVNNLVLPSEVYPSLRFEMEQLTKKIYEAVRKMEVVAREAVGLELLEMMAEAMEGFIEAANGHEDIDEYLQNLVKLTRHINARMKVISDLKIVDDNIIYLILVQIRKVQKKTAGAIEDRQSRKGKQNRR